MKFLKIFMVTLVVISLVYILGPKAHADQLDLTMTSLDVELSELEDYIAGNEAEVQELKPDNEARIIWADSSKEKTTYSIVYLHGFSASPMEGRPVHVEIAKRFGANLYLPRLYGHGTSEVDAFLDLTPQKLLDSGKEALAIGNILGDSVILMSCSTGGTLSVILAANSSDVHSQILYSPNFEFAKPGSDMLTKPWGLQMARMMFKGKYRSLADWPAMAPYWTMRYRLEGLINIKLLVEMSMKDKTFEKVTQPTFIGYYYKDEEHQDEIVSVPHMQHMFETISTPKSLKKEVAFPNVNSHVITSDIQSADVNAVIEETFNFCKDVLKIPVSTN